MDKKPIKIFIVGGPGSGKTTMAKALAVKLGVVHFDLDEIKWINKGGDVYTGHRPKEERIKMLAAILKKNKSWVIEGAYYKEWIHPVIEQADEVIILKTSTIKRHWRVIRRSIRRQLGFEKSKYKENMKSLWTLLKWSHVYDRDYLPHVLEKIIREKKKFVIKKK